MSGFPSDLETINRLCMIGQQLCLEHGDDPEEFRTLIAIMSRFEIPLERLQAAEIVGGAPRRKSVAAVPPGENTMLGFAQQFAENATRSKEVTAEYISNLKKLNSRQFWYAIGLALIYGWLATFINSRFIQYGEDVAQNAGYYYPGFGSNDPRRTLPSNQTRELISKDLMKKYDQYWTAVALSAPVDVTGLSVEEKIQFRPFPEFVYEQLGKVTTETREEIDPVTRVKRTITGPKFEFGSYKSDWERNANLRMAETKYYFVSVIRWIAAKEQLVFEEALDLQKALIKAAVWRSAVTFIKGFIFTGKPVVPDATEAIEVWTQGPYVAAALGWLILMWSASLTSIDGVIGWPLQKLGLYGTREFYRREKMIEENYNKTLKDIDKSIVQGAIVTTMMGAQRPVVPEPVVPPVPTARNTRRSTAANPLCTAQNIAKWKDQAVNSTDAEVRQGAQELLAQCGESI